jgi:L-2-hydroxyglutarate oxidase
MNSNFFNLVIIGGGVIGCSIARKIGKEFRNIKIGLIEKENNLGTHTSTRNSSVIHSGIYYSTDSFKAKFCREGNI